VRHSFGEVTALTRAVARARTRADVLDALCSRIRHSLGTSTAYVAVNRAGGREAVVCSSRGIVTSSFRTLRLPHSVGLGGVVASDGVPRSTEDYAEDGTFFHSSALDLQVREEGLRGIAAAPVVVGGDVIGAAMVGERHVRRFASQELDLLEALCTIAAVAIDHHALLHAAVRRARDAVECANRLREVVRRQRELLVMTAPEARARERRELCEDLVAGRLDEHSYRVRCGVLGLDPAQPYDVLAIAPASPLFVAGNVRLGASASDPLVAVQERQSETTVFTLVPPGEAVGPSAVAERLGLGPNATVGVAGPAGDVRGLRDATVQATRTLRVLRGLGRPGAVAGAASLGPLGLLAAGGDPGEIKQVLDVTLAPLATLDEQRRERHLATLAAWFDQDASVKRTARALGVHVNTVYGRLAELDELFGPDWRGGRRRLEIETAVRLQVLGVDLGAACGPAPVSDPSR
jgi:hypothetical protein